MFNRISENIYFLILNQNLRILLMKNKWSPLRGRGVCEINIPTALFLSDHE